MINLPILQQHTTDNISSFNKYWKDYYDESYQRDYFEIIEKVVWDESDIEKLFKWKNNMGKEEKKLGKTKRTYVARASSHLDWINKNKDNVSIKDFIKEFKNLGPVWSITLLHAMSPLQFPIYDQHVHRAYCYFTNLPFITLKREDVYHLYQEQYLPFFREFTNTLDKTVAELKEVDNALWAFGKFLKQYSGMVTYTKKSL